MKPKLIQHTALLILLVQGGFECKAQNGAQNRKDYYIISKPLTGNVAQPVNLRIRHFDTGFQSYSVRMSKKWLNGRFTISGPNNFETVLVDFDFDGYSDLWITGVTDGQGRLRRSDVWLFNPKQKRYEYNSELSGIENLEIDPEEKKFEGGIWNCGCAALCFFRDTYQWRRGSLLKVARREQDCSPDGLIYKELELIDGILKVVRSQTGEPDNTEAERRHSGSLRFLDWSKGITKTH